MEEREIIGKIRELRQIKPNQKWVILTKSQILGEEKKYTSLFPFKPVYAGLFLFLILIGLFEFSQSALPGELLYPLKRITEKAQAIFVSEEERPKLNLELANKRLEELSKIAEKNEVKKLAPAINEYQASVSEAAKNLTKIIAATTSDPTIIQKIVEESQKLEKKKEKIEVLLDVVLDEDQVEEGIQAVLARQIVIWKTLINNLSNELEIKEKLGELMNQAEEYYQAGDYYQASQILAEIYMSYPQP